MADKKANKNSDYNERLLDGVLKNLLDGVITSDSRGIIRSVNQAFCKMSGYEEGELVGQSVNLLMSQHIADVHDGYLENARQSETDSMGVLGNKRYLKVLCKDGSHFLAEISVSRMELDDEVLFIAGVYDVTDRVEKEKLIWELARYPEEAWNPIMKIAEDGKLKYANASSDTILESWHIHIGDKAPPDVQKVVSKCLTEYTPESIIIECDGDGKGIKYFELLITPIMDLRAVYVYGRDVTQSKKDRQELEAHRNLLENMVRQRTDEAVRARDEAEKASEAKSLFLANMSHEIRTPLTAIVGYAENLLEEGLSEAERKNFLNTVIHSSYHLTEIINDVLDVSKIEANKIELEVMTIELCEMINDVQTLFASRASEKGISFMVDCQYPLPGTIQSDPVRLKQILINLCSNAIKFTNQGGVSIHVSYDEPGKRLSISVKDTGIGMTNEQLERIFKPFVQADSSMTRNYGGTGLGLYLSNRLAKLLGDELTVSSVPGEGSTFTCQLSLAHMNDIKLITGPAQTIKKTALTEKQGDMKLSGRVLLVEDTPELQMLVARYITKTGLDVDVVGNGEEVQKIAFEQDYDVILMDIQMPIMDGYTSVRLLRARKYNKPVIALTANAMEKDRQKCLDSGFDDYLAKPVKKAELIEKLSLYVSPGEKGEEENHDNECHQIAPLYLEQCEEAIKHNNWEAIACVLQVIKELSSESDFIKDYISAAEKQLAEKNADGLRESLFKISEYKKLNIPDYKSGMN